MNRYYKYYEGEIWNTGDKTKISESDIGITVNQFFSNINTAAPLMTDNEPKWTIRARKPFLQKMATIYKDVGDCLYDVLDLKQKSFLAVIDAFVFGKGIGKVYFDPESGYAGELCFDIIDPRTFVYPKGYTDIWEMPWCGEVFQKPLDWIRLKYPENGMKVKPDGGDKKVVDGDTDASGNYKFGAESYELSDSFATIYSIWIRDHETEEVIEKNVEKGKDGEDVEIEKKTTKLKYPNGKILVFCKNMDEPLEEKPYPYDHGKPPYVDFTDYYKPHAFEGIGEIEMIESLVLENNLLFRKICKFVHDWADPNFYMDDTNTLDPTKWKKDAPGGGNLFVIAQGSKPPQAAITPPYNGTAVDLVGALAKYVDEVSGINDMTKGMVTKKQRQSKFEIQSLNEASYTRPRQKIRNFDQFISRSFYLIIAIMQQYYTEPRTYGKNTPEGQVWSQISNTREFAEKAYNPGQSPETQDENEKQQYDEAKKDFDALRDYLGMDKELRFDFEIQVESGSYLPLDRQSKANLYLSLLDKKIGPDSLIDVESVLDALQLPEKDKILERLKAMQAANLKLQQGGQPPEGA